MIDFFSAGFQIKTLLRRRGFTDVKPMGGKNYGLMPKDLFSQWSKFPKRQKLIKKAGGTKEFERLVAQILIENFNNPATFSNRVMDLGPGGDYDVLGIGPDGALLHFETKTGREIKIPEVWNFMVREASLGSDLSIFLYDVNFDLRKNLLPIFFILHSLSKLIKNDRENTEAIKSWLVNLKKERFQTYFVEIARFGESGVYFLYWPLLVINGGDYLQRNIGLALRYFYSFLKYRSPTELRIGKTRFPLYGEENWSSIKKLLPRGAEKIIKKSAERIGKETINGK